MAVKKQKKLSFKERQKQLESITKINKYCKYRKRKSSFGGIVGGFISILVGSNLLNKKII